MNSLSWLIYFASIISGFKALFLFLSIVCCIIIIVAWIARVANPEEYNRHIREAATKWTNWRSIYVYSILFLLACIVIPTSSTMYMIAASELGETVVKSPEAIELFDQLKQLIKQKITEELK